MQLDSPITLLELMSIMSEVNAVKGLPSPEDIAKMNPDDITGEITIEPAALLTVVQIAVLRHTTPPTPEEGVTIEEGQWFHLNDIPLYGGREARRLVDMALEDAEMLMDVQRNIGRQQAMQKLKHALRDGMRNSESKANDKGEVGLQIDPTTGKMQAVTLEDFMKKVEQDPNAKVVSYDTDTGKIEGGTDIPDGLKRLIGGMLGDIISKRKKS